MTHTAISVFITFVKYMQENEKEHFNQYSREKRCFKQQMCRLEMCSISSAFWSELSQQPHHVCIDDCLFCSWSINLCEALVLFYV